MADYYESRWKTFHPQGKVLKRDLAREPIPHLDESTIAVFYARGDQPEGKIPSGIALSNDLISELMEADEIVISSALYDFSMPSALKAWIDHIVRFGYIVSRGTDGPVDLLSKKRVCFLTARGGTPERDPDYQQPVLEAVFSYIGVEDIRWVSLEGTRISDDGLESRISRSRSDIDQILSEKI